MTFSSNAVELQWNRNNLILKRGASTLVINPEHVQTLRTQDNQESFNDFFLNTALQNREARRVFQAWERKDSALLAKIYTEMTAQ
jgi:hypothetical protein